MSSCDAGSPQGEVSGAFLIGMISSLSNTRIIESELMPFATEHLLPDAWYPYDYLIKLNALIEEKILGSSSILFWAGVKFIEIWYWQGSGKQMIRSGLDWVYCNDKGGGYNSVVRGERVGWCRNLVADERQGYALVENVMPMAPAYLRGIFFGGFYLFDDMAYFNTEINSVSNGPDYPFQRTIIKLIFKKSQVAIEKSKISLLDTASKQAAALTAQEAEEVLWRYRHQLNLSVLRDEYNKNISELMQRSYENLQTLKEELAAANQRLALEAITDSLTGLNNKRYFNQEVVRILNVAKRNRYSVCIMMIDIDYFKKYNDHYGHLAGDAAIQAVAECIGSQFSRGSDLVARFGGEEFVCVTTNTNETGIRILVEKISEALKSQKILHEKSDVSDYLTVSIGSVMCEEKFYSIETLLKLADGALYQAKEQGRGRHVHVSCCAEKMAELG